MKNKHIIEPQQDAPAWRLVSAILVFIAALVIAALLSIDDVDTQRRGTTELEHALPR